MRGDRDGVSHPIRKEKATEGWPFLLAGIVPENIAPLINDGSSDISIGLASFLTDALQNEDLSAPRGFLIYITFDADMNVISDHSDILAVSSPNQLEFLQSEQLVMPENGYFYTYLTNTSDQLVSFDNLTVHHKQGRVRALYDYYPYGLMWSNVRDDQYDNTFEGSEFAHGEWGISGLNMNYFEARWYDPALGRWHSPDPLEQFHSAYVGMANDPANFIDPDGRNAREWLKSNWQEVGIIACQIGMSAWCIAGCPGVGQISATVQAVTGTMAAGGTGAALIRTEIQVSNFTSSCSSNPSAMLDDALAGCGGYQSHGKVGLSFELASPDGWVQPQSNGKNVGGPEYYVGVTEQGHADAMALGDITYQYLGESASYLSTFGYVLLMPNAQWSFGGSPTIHQGTMNIVWSYNYMSEVISAQHEEWIKIAQQFNVLGEFVENTVHAAEFVLSTCLTFGAGGLAINSIKAASREALPCVATKIEVVISADAAVGVDRVIVIGEGMGAVKTTAKTLQSQGINAKWYQAWSKNFPTNRLMTPAEMDAALARNARWLNSKINQGYKIYDIGIDFTRTARSPFYQLERSILQQRKFPTTLISR